MTQHDAERPEPDRGDPWLIGQAKTALAEFGVAFEPVFVDRLQRAYGATWRTDRGFQARPGDDRPVSYTSDESKQLEYLSDRDLHRHFETDRPNLDRRIRQTAQRLRDDRNLVHHSGPVENIQVDRMIGDLEAVLHHFDIHSADVNLRDIRAGLAARRQTDADSLEALRRDYVEGLRARIQRVSLDALSEVTGTRRVEVRLRDVFVPPALRLSRPDDPSADDELIDDVDELLGERRLAVIGGPGAGKTTLLHRLANEMALPSTPEGRTAHLPVLLRARDVAAAMTRDESLGLRRHLLQHERYAPLFQRAVRDGSAHLLIDGIDEVPDQATRARLVDAIATFLADYPAIPVVVTSRPTGLRGIQLRPPFVEATIQPFDAERIERFLRHWAALRPPSDESRMVEDLLDALGEPVGPEASGLAELASQPLLLALLYLLWSRGAGLPTRHVELIAVMTDTLLAEWPAERLRERTGVADAFYELLAPVASGLLESGEDEIGHRDVRDAFRHTLVERVGVVPDAARTEADTYLRLIEEHTGFFQPMPREPGERRYGFVHRQFLEYMAAWDLADRLERDEDGLALRLVDDRGLGEIREMVFGRLDLRGRTSVSRVLQKLLTIETSLDEYMATTARFALRLLASDIVRPDPQTRDAILERALDAAVSVWSRDVRRQLFEDLRRVRERTPFGPRLMARLAPKESDDPRTQRTKALLRLMGEDTDVRAMEAITGGSVAADPEVVLQGATILGGQVTDRDMWLRGSAPDLPWLLLLPHDPFWDVPASRVMLLPDEAGDRFVGAGVEWVARSEVYGSPGSLTDRPGAWLVHRDDLADPTVEELVRLGRSRNLAEIRCALLPPDEWYVARAAEIRDLAGRPSDAAGLDISFWEDTAYAPEWIEVWRSLIRSGPSVSGASWLLPKALREIVFKTAEISEDASETSSETDDSWEPDEIDLSILVDGPSVIDMDEQVHAAVDEAARSPDPQDRLAVVAGLAEDSGWEPAVRLLADDPEPPVRGAARAALLAGRYVALFVYPRDADIVSAVELGLVGPAAMERLIARYVGAVDQPGEEGGIAREMLERLLRAVSTTFPLAIDMGDAEAHLLALARILVSDEDPRARASAARIVASPRRAPAGDLVARLATDVDHDVRRHLSPVFQKPDLAEVGWLWDALPGMFEAWTDQRAVHTSADELAVISDRRTLDEIEMIVKLHLGDRPDDAVALHFAWNLFG